MKRLLPALGLALLVHAGLLALNGVDKKENYPIRTDRRPITLSLVEKRAEKRIVPPAPPKNTRPAPQKRRKIVSKTDKIPPMKKKAAPIEKPPVQEKEVPLPARQLTEQPQEATAEIEEQHNDLHIPGETVPLERALKEVVEIQADIEYEPVALVQSNPRPVYPEVARRRMYQGEVLLKVHVNKNGRVDNVDILKSSGYSLLDRAAEKSVKSWLFTPGRIGDRTVDWSIEIPIKFELE